MVKTAKKGTTSEDKKLKVNTTKPIKKYLKDSIENEK